jgi:Ankyrin repeats (3 copies)/Ankyrin repeat
MNKITTTASFPLSYYVPDHSVRVGMGLTVALCAIYAAGIVASHFTVLGNMGMCTFALGGASFLGLVAPVVLPLLLKNIREARRVQKDLRPGESLLQAASRCGNLPLAKFLIQKGENVNFQNAHSWDTPLISACRRGDLQMVKLLVENNADVNQLSTQSLESPLHAACINNCTEIAGYLLARTANPNLITASGQTALHLAAQNNNPELVQLLLDGGADKTIKNCARQTPYAVADASDSIRVKHLLKLT